MGHRVLVYVRPRYAKERYEEYKGVWLQRMPSIPTKSLDTISYTLLASISVLFKDVDVIHYHGVGPATLAWIPRLFKPSAKVVVTFHSIDRMHQKWGPIARAYLHFGEWAAVRFAHATIAVSKSIQSYCRKRYGAKVQYIPNGAMVLPYPGKDLLAQWGLKPNGYILNVARIVRQKGIHFLIEAYGRLDTDKKLVIVGAPAFGSEYWQTLKKMSEGNSGIVFAGFQSGRALRQLFANAYLYAHPSMAEGLSVSILEAMAAGRAVLVSDIPENKESIDHSGVTFASENIDDLAAKMQALLNHAEIAAQLGAKGRGWVEHEYNWDRIAAETADFFGKIRRKN
jgi:glycosyltransferase involved in cell wall biosynthesis